MTEFRITLTPAETELLAQIELDAHKIRYEIAARNGQFVTALMEMLTAREGAIPAHRIAYFTDAEYNIGGHGKSRQEAFERNLRSGTLFEHPHFLAYLRYFINGPELRDSVMTSFAQKVEECGMVTSGDIVPLAKHARQLTKSHALNSHDAAEEFFKLALELGLDTGYARVIRDNVRGVR